MYKIEQRKKQKIKLLGIKEFLLIKSKFNRKIKKINGGKGLNL